MRTVLLPYRLCTTYVKIFRRNFSVSFDSNLSPWPPTSPARPDRSRGGRARSRRETVLFTTYSTLPTDTAGPSGPRPQGAGVNVSSHQGPSRSASVADRRGGHGRTSLRDYYYLRRANRSGKPCPMAPDRPARSVSERVPFVRTSPGFPRPDRDPTDASRDPARTETLSLVPRPDPQRRPETTRPSPDLGINYCGPLGTVRRTRTRVPSTTRPVGTAQGPDGPGSNAGVTTKERSGPGGPSCEIGRKNTSRLDMRRGHPRLNTVSQFDGPKGKADVGSERDGGRRSGTRGTRGTRRRRRRHSTSYRYSVDRTSRTQRCSSATPAH